MKIHKATLKQHVYGHGTLVPGRALWVGLDIEGSRVGILNVYAPIDLRRRSAFWSTLTGLLPKMDSWIVEGGFNNIEALEDHHGWGPDFTGITYAK